MSEIFPESPLTSLPDAVAAMGALPVPVGPQPQADADRAKAPWGRGEDGRPLLPMGAHWTDVPELVDQELARVKSRVDEATSGHWYASPVPGDRPGTVSTRVGGVPLTVGQCTNMLPADLDLVLHAHADLGWCLEMIAKFRARVAELEAERHETNEALDDAVRELRARQSCPCPPADQPGPHQLGCPQAEVPSPPSERPVNGLTATFMPVAALRELSSREEPHDSPLHQAHRISHDLPLGCGLTDAQVEQLGNPFLDGGA